MKKAAVHERRGVGGVGRIVSGDRERSGIVRPGKLSVIGNGVVIDPWHLAKEIEGLKETIKLLNQEVAYLNSHLDAKYNDIASRKGPLRP